MTLSPEQFNKLITRAEHQLLVEKVDSLDEKFDKMMFVIEGIATNAQELINAQHLNQAAHDCFNDNFIKIRAEKFEEVEIV